MAVLDPEHVESGVTPVRLNLTASALERIREMLAEEDLLEEGGLRITMKPGAGCSGTPRFGMVMEVEPDDDDTVLEADGVRIFLDPTSAWALDGLRLDWVDSPTMGSGFAFQHPRGRGGRAC
ncbi:MAG: iron-sulfur cluster assembly accessory protein [Gemmatimonadales bacterium]|nr:MAG: iron-sulfur cluster assembly accessory protein [Gemmatimonadales bacterium]